jgi:hypothetical protein
MTFTFRFLSDCIALQPIKSMSNYDLNLCNRKYWQVLKVNACMDMLVIYRQVFPLLMGVLVRVVSSPSIGSFHLEPGPFNLLCRPVDVCLRYCNELLMQFTSSSAHHQSELDTSRELLYILYFCYKCWRFKFFFSSIFILPWILFGSLYIFPVISAQSWAHHMHS